MPHSKAPGQEASLDPPPESSITPHLNVSPLVPLLDKANILLLFARV